jgi:hypothetical protein
MIRQLSSDQSIHWEPDGHRLAAMCCTFCQALTLVRLWFFVLPYASQSLVYAGCWVEAYALLVQLCCIAVSFHRLFHEPKGKSYAFAHFSRHLHCLSLLLVHLRPQSCQAGAAVFLWQVGLVSKVLQLTMLGAAVCLETRCLDSILSRSTRCFY